MEAALDQFVELFQALIAQGPVGIGLGLVVILAIVTFRYTGLVKSGNQARLVIGLLSFGLPGGEFGDSEAWVARILTAVFSTLLFTWGEGALKKVAENKAE